MKKLLMLLLNITLLLLVFSCTGNKVKMITGTGNENYDLNLLVDYYGGDITLEELNTAVTVKIYNSKDEKEKENVAFKYNGGDFFTEDKSKTISIAPGSYIEVILTAKDVEKDSTYIANIDSTIEHVNTSHNFTISNKTTLFIVFSEDDIIAKTTKVPMESFSGGKVAINIIREMGPTTNTIIYKELLQNSGVVDVDIPNYYFSDKYHRVELVASPVNNNQSIEFKFDGWMRMTPENSEREKITSETKVSLTINNSGAIYLNSINVFTETKYKKLQAFFDVIPPSYAVGKEPKNKVSGGTHDGWYLIKDKDELLYIADQIEKNNSTWINAKLLLNNDIDYKNEWHKPIGGLTPFSGAIDGNGFSIKNAKFGTDKTGTGGNANYVTGFVGLLTGGSISNLTIDKSCTIEATGNLVGAIVASMEGAKTSSSVVLNCVNNASIKAYIGKVLFNTANAYHSVGGIVGGTSQRGMIIRNVHNSADIYVESSAGSSIAVGGIIGQASAATADGSVEFINAYNTGDIEYTGNTTPKKGLGVGGVVGYINNSGIFSFTNTYSTGKITTGSKDYTGGVVGHLYYGGLYPTHGTYNFKDMYFVNKNNLLDSGYPAVINGNIPTSAIPNMGGAISESDLSSLAGTFNDNITANVWQTQNRKPVIPNIGKK